jgi:hypothetical protein
MDNNITHEARQEQNYKLRSAFWNGIGKLDTDVLTHLINPTFSGAPSWPDLRQAFARITTPNSVILATDGLSDEFADSKEANNGFEIELYVEFNDPQYTQSEIGKLNSTWMFRLLNQTASNAASNGQFRELLDKYGVLSMELYDINLPQNFKNSEGRVGVLLGMQSQNVPSEMQLYASRTKLTSITLLTADELEYVAANGAAGRNEVAQRLVSSGNKNICSTTRNSVIE